ncbi:MAG: hypothetical protein M3R05_00305 [Chloroflexota bacterium]|nr:hypothetical protein [Chloroflexota bacterium]
MDYPEEFDEDKLYDQFPRGDEYRVGPDQGFNSWVKINDPNLFTEAARERPEIKEFLAAPFSVNYAQFKSSFRETEYFIHKPHRAMGGKVEGIKGTVEGFPDEPDKQRIATLVVNHELTLARHITRSLTIEDGHLAGQMIHKEPEPTP